MMSPNLQYESDTAASKECCTVMCAGRHCWRRLLTWVVDNDVVEVDHDVGSEPHDHDGRKSEADFTGPVALASKQEHQDSAGHANDSACVTGSLSYD